MPVRLLKKITPKHISEAVKVPYNLLEMPRPNGYVEDRHLYDVFGVVTRIRQGATDKGAWVQFKGRFRAVTPPDADGVVEVFESGAMHVPGGTVEDMLFAAYDEAKAGNQGNAVAIEIALRVSIKRAPSGKISATGYVYDVQPLVERKVAADDPIERLMKEAAQLQLPAPKKEPEPVPTPAPETAPAAAAKRHGK